MGKHGFPHDGGRLLWPLGNSPGGARILTSRWRGAAWSVILNYMVQYPTTIDRTFAALGDPTRRAIVERLGGGSATITELATPFGMTLTGMKKHVRVLEDARLVRTEKVGRARRCSLV